MTAGRTAWRSFLLAAATLALVTPAASAQTIPVHLLPPAGTKVRADALLDGGQNQIIPGLFIEGDARRIVVRAAQSGLIEIADESLVGLEVDGGRSSGRGALKGALYGTLGGAVIIGAIAAAGTGGSGCIIACTTGSAFALGGFVGALLGAPVGTLAGAMIKSQRWERIR